MTTCSLSFLSIYIQPKFTPRLFPLPPFVVTPVLYPTPSHIMDQVYEGLAALVWFILNLCGLTINLLRAVWGVLVSRPVGSAVSHGERGLAFGTFMEELSPRQAAVKQLKRRLLQAIEANDAQEVMKILHGGKIDIDAVLEVEDPDMVLASYKQGEEEENDSPNLVLGCGLVQKKFEK